MNISGGSEGCSTIKMYIYTNNIIDIYTCRIVVLLVVLGNGSFTQRVMLASGGSFVTPMESHNPLAPLQSCNHAKPSPNSGLKSVAVCNDWNILRPKNLDLFCKCQTSFIILPANDTGYIRIRWSIPQIALVLRHLKRMFFCGRSW